MGTSHSMAPSEGCATYGRRSASPVLPRQRGFTVLELVVAIAVMAILIAILLPALAAAREVSRRTTCVAHLQQIGVALNAFEAQNGRLPKARWHKVELLPFLDHKAVADDALHADAPMEETLNKYVIPVYQCPTDSPETSDGVGYANYAGCFGSGSLTGEQNGVFPNSRNSGTGLPISKIVDGLSATVAMAEFLHGRTVNGVGTGERLRTIWETPVQFAPPTLLDEFADYCDSIPPVPMAYGWVGSPFRGLPWHHDDRISGLYNHVLGPNRPSCTNHSHVPTGAFTATSLHGGGVNVLFVDGHVEFINETIDRQVWREMGARNDRLHGMDNDPPM